MYHVPDCLLDANTFLDSLSRLSVHHRMFMFNYTCWKLLFWVDQCFHVFQYFVESIDTFTHNIITYSTSNLIQSVRHRVQKTRLSWVNTIFSYIHDCALLFNCCPPLVHLWLPYTLNTPFPWCNILYIDKHGKLVHVVVFVVLLNLRQWFFILFFRR